ncbi:hypothetical protein KOW79_016475 [Hemibagrus wyckioides]|uniref:Uncharacterized protein n=1 Tax=Hemibagrus wyckioides TaxID=337641 RepID=A0A9D3NE62_9TELE|nr:hypothetical protein KOW79_016475 [Hemibagrus wyckioides]
MPNNVEGENSETKAEKDVDREGLVNKAIYGYCRFLDERQNTGNYFFFLSTSIKVGFVMTSHIPVCGQGRELRGERGAPGDSTGNCACAMQIARLFTFPKPWLRNISDTSDLSTDPTDC